MICSQGIKESQQVEVEDSPFGGLVLIPSDTMRRCTICQSPDNLIGYEVSLSAAGRISLWYFCQEHLTVFEFEKSAVIELNDQTEQRYAIKELK